MRVLDPGKHRLLFSFLPVRGEREFKALITYTGKNVIRVAVDRSISMVIDVDELDPTMTPNTKVMINIDTGIITKL